MFIDKEYFEAWMERIMDRFDHTDKTLKDMSKLNNIVAGERLLDNQDLCKLLNVSKRTLQRYRSNGELPFHTIYHKTYYRERDVHEFIRIHFDKSGSGENSYNDNPQTK